MTTSEEEDERVVPCTYCRDSAYLDINAGCCMICAAPFCYGCEQSGGLCGCDWACACEPACEGLCWQERALVCWQCIEDESRIVGIEADEQPAAPAD